MGLLSKETGIILLPPFEQLGKMNLSYSKHDAQLLFFLSYFERIKIVALNPLTPTGPIIASTELEQELVHQGVIGPTFSKRFRQRGPFDGEFLSDHAQRAFRHWNSGTDGTWAVATPPEVAPDLKAEALNSLVMLLEKCLPCPKPTVPANEVIGFRTENAASLDQLHLHLNRLYFSVGNGLELSDIETLVSGALSEAISDIRRNYDRFRIPFFDIDLNLGLKLPPEMVVLAAELVGSGLGFPGIAGVASCLTLNIAKHQLAKTGNEYPTDFSYVLSGIRKGYLEKYPNDDPFALDIRDVEITANDLENYYPATVTKPGGWRGGTYIGNVST